MKPTQASDKNLTDSALNCKNCGGRLRHMDTSTQGVAMFVEEYCCVDCGSQGSIRSKLTGCNPVRFAGAVFGGVSA